MEVGGLGELMGNRGTANSGIWVICGVLGCLGCLGVREYLFGEKHR